MRIVPVTNYMALPGLNPSYNFEGFDSLKVRRIISIVEEEYKISYARLKSVHRYANIVEPRQVAIYLLKLYTKKPLKAIAGLFGGRDHTTAIHSIARVKDLIDTEPEYKRRIQKLINNIDRIAAEG